MCGYVCVQVLFPGESEQRAGLDIGRHVLHVLPRTEKLIHRLTSTLHLTLIILFLPFPFMHSQIICLIITPSLLWRTTMLWTSQKQMFFSHFVLGHTVCSWHILRSFYLPVVINTIPYFPKNPASARMNCPWARHGIPSSCRAAVLIGANWNRVFRDRSRYYHVYLASKIKLPLIASCPLCHILV